MVCRSRWVRQRRVRTRIRHLIALGSLHWASRGGRRYDMVRAVKVLGICRSPSRAAGAYERMASSPRSFKHEDIMGRACSSSLDRRMRTRTYGGVVWVKLSFAKRIGARKKQIIKRLATARENRSSRGISNPNPVLATNSVKYELADRTHAISYAGVSAC